MKLISACLAGAIASTASAENLRSESINNIPTTAANNGSFETLVTTLTSANLVGALSEEGPFTVFAPTDDAFQALEDANEGITACLLRPENKQVLTDILMYHVASGKVLSTHLENNMKIDTLLGEDVEVTIQSGSVSINDSKVVIPDVLATNGVIHAIDSVLVPASVGVGAFLASCLAPAPVVCSHDGQSRPAGQSLTGSTHTCTCGTNGKWYHCKKNADETHASVTQASVYCSYMGQWKLAGLWLTGPTHTCVCGSDERWHDCYLNADVSHAPSRTMTIEELVVDSDRLSTLETAIAAADLLGVLDGEGPFTVFAPSDRAFSAVPAPLLDFLLDPANRAILASVLKYHVVGGSAVEASALSDGDEVKTLLGEDVKIEKVCWSQEGCDEYSLAVNDSYVVAADVDAENGIVHIIDAVLIPPSLSEAVAGILAQEDTLWER